MYIRYYIYSVALIFSHDSACNDEIKCSKNFATLATDIKGVQAKINFCLLERKPINYKLIENKKEEKTSTTRDLHIY